MALSFLATRCHARLSRIYARSFSVTRNCRDQSLLSAEHDRLRPVSQRGQQLTADGWKTYALDVDGWENKSTTAQSKIRADHLLGDLSPHERQLQVALLRDGTNAMRILQEHANDGRLTVHVVRLCLEAARRELWRGSRPKRQELLQQSSGNHAKTVLRLILPDRSLWLPLFTHDPRTTFNFCWFAVAQGLEINVIKWLKADFSSDANIQSMELHEANPQAWRASLLRALVEAHLASEYHSADGAIKCFSSIREWKTEVCQRTISPDRRSPTAMRHFANSLNTFKASRAISGAITSGWAFNTNVRLFERFQKATSEMFDTHPEGMPGLNYAILDMFHPTRSSPAAFLDLLRPTLQDVNSMRLLDSLHASHPRHIPMRLWERAYALCVSARNLQDASLMSQSYAACYNCKIDEKIAERDWKRRVPRSEQNRTTTQRVFRPK